MHLRYRTRLALDDTVRDVNPAALGEQVDHQLKEIDFMQDDHKLRLQTPGLDDRVLRNTPSNKLGRRELVIWRQDFEALRQHYFLALDENVLVAFKAHILADSVVLSALLG